MDDNKVFDDKPLKDAIDPVPRPGQLPDPAPRDIWDDKSKAQPAEGLSLNRSSNVTDQTRADLKSGSESAIVDTKKLDQKLKQLDGEDLSRYYQPSAPEPKTPEPEAPGPRGDYANNNLPDIDLAPKTEQTYEQVQASAQMAAASASASAQTKKKVNVKAIVAAIIIFLILIAGLVGAYFYIKFINTPQYLLNQAFTNFSKQKSDTVLSYQVKKGSVYEEVLSVADKSDANNNLENDVEMKIGASKLKFNLLMQSNKYYLKTSGLEASSKEAEKNSPSLAATIKSTGTVMDEQWVELDTIKNPIMPSSVIAQFAGLSSAVDKSSITEVGKDGDITSYTVSLDAAKVKAMVANVYDSKTPDLLKQYNIKPSDYLSPESVAKLNFRVEVNSKTKIVTKLIISSSQKEKVLNLSFSAHKNGELLKPVQVKKLSEVSGELESATSQSGVNLGPLLK
jgi:hypothetical protein